METNTIYNVTYFINKFEAISFIGERGLSHCCSLHYCGVTTDNETSKYNETEEALALDNIFLSNANERLVKDVSGFNGNLNSVWLINDDRYNNIIDGNSAKERILNYLYQIRDKQLQS